MDMTASTTVRVIDRRILEIGVAGWLATLVALLFFPVFAPDGWICKGPYGVPLACGYISAPLRTAWEWERDGQYTIPPLFFLLIGLGVLFLLAVAVRHWISATLAMVASFIWLLYLGLWLYAYLPRPVSVGYIIAILLASIGSGLIAALSIRLIVHSWQRHARR